MSDQPAPKPDKSAKPAPAPEALPPVPGVVVTELPDGMVITNYTNETA